MLQLHELKENMFYSRIYWIEGDLPSAGRNRNEVKNPPNSGWSHVIVIGDLTSKFVTVFCPNTLNSFQISNKSAEFNSLSKDFEWGPIAKKPSNNEVKGFKKWEEEDTQKLINRLKKNWQDSVKLSLPNRDYDMATLILTKLGAEIPESIPKESHKDKVSGGKEVSQIGLKKPVKSDSKRGQILAFFLPKFRSIREAMAEFNTTRSNVLSHLFMLQKEHGIGYRLQNDGAFIDLPEGCSNPFII